MRGSGGATGGAAQLAAQLATGGREADAYLLAVLSALIPLMQGNYSNTVYGGPGRVPNAMELKVLWLSLLPDAALRLVRAAGGVCRSHAQFPLPVLYSPQHIDRPQQDAAWLRSNLYLSHSQPVPSFSWVEVRCAQAPSFDDVHTIPSDPNHDQN